MSRCSGGMTRACSFALVNIVVEGFALTLPQAESGLGWTSQQGIIEHASGSTGHAISSHVHNSAPWGKGIS